MARRSFLQRLIDDALDIASRTLGAVNEGLDQLVPPAVESEPDSTPVRRGRRESLARRPRSRIAQLEQQLADLARTVTSQQAQITQQQAQIRNQQQEVETLRRERRATPPPSSEPRNTPRYPIRLEGRLPHQQWTPDNLRLQLPDRNAVEAKYTELLQAIGNQNLLALVQRDRHTFQLFVGGS